MTSQVLAQYEDHIPTLDHIDIKDYQNAVVGKELTASIEKYRGLIKSFYEAYAAASEFDTLTGATKCHDPEKAAFLRRVDRLADILKEPPPVTSYDLTITTTYSGVLHAEDWVDSDTTIDDLVEKIKTDEWLRSDVIEDLLDNDTAVQVAVLSKVTV